MSNYASALEGSGMEGVFSLDLSQAKSCAGLLLPGGGDISPARYGQEPDGSEEPDLRRDEAELELVADFDRLGTAHTGNLPGDSNAQRGTGGRFDSGHSHRCRPPA